MNCSEAAGFRFGNIHPALELDETMFKTWMDRSVLSLEACADCAFALICRGGCSRLALSHGKDISRDAVCPPSINHEHFQILMDYYLPRIREKYHSPEELDRPGVQIP
jgi:radical SAM protein with 4Fe4S-binding SPASM domain